MLEHSAKVEASSVPQRSLNVKASAVLECALSVDESGVPGRSIEVEASDMPERLLHVSKSGILEESLDINEEMNLDTLIKEAGLLQCSGSGSSPTNFSSDLS